MTAGALAAESENLSRDDRASSRRRSSRREPSLADLNDALPPLRALAIELRPGHPGAAGDDRRGRARGSTRPTAAARRPSSAGSPRLLRGDARRARRRPTAASKELLPQIDGLSSCCVTQNLVPTGDIVDRRRRHVVGGTGQPNFQEFFYGAGQPGRRRPGLRRQRPLPARPAGRRPACSVQGAESAGGLRDTVNFRNTIEAPAGHPAGASRPRRRRSGRTSPATRNPLPDVNGPGRPRSGRRPARRSP